MTKTRHLLAATNKRLVHLFLAGCLLSISACAVFTGPSPEEILNALREGGHVIYFRHAQTGWAQQDHLETLADASSCDPQRMRQLSEEGREKTRRLGTVIRQLKIPTRDVFASEYCRTIETAELLGLGKVVPTRDVISTGAAKFLGGREKLKTAALALVSTTPQAGTNTVIVSHSNVYGFIDDSSDLEELGAAILLPDGRGGFTLRTTLTPEDWNNLIARGNQH